MIREKGLIVGLVLFFFLLNGAYAGTLDDVVLYAQQYESGSLDYVKFKVHLQVLEEEFREQLEEQRQEFTLDEEEKKVDRNQGRELERLGNQAEEALRTEDKEKLIQIIDQIDAEFARLGNNQSILIQKIRTAAERGNFEEVERLADDLPEDEFRRDEDQHDEQFQTEGWSLETVKNIFGEPTGLSNNLWLSNEQRSVVIDEEIPQFEKKVFDGEKVKVTLHAWPNGLQQKGKTIIFYHIGLESVFKQQADELPDTMIQDIVAKAKQYQEGTIAVEELAKDAAQRERIMYEFLRENQEQCKTFLGSLLPDRKEVTVTAFRGFLVDSKELSAEAVIQHQQGEEEHYSLWFDVRSKQGQPQGGSFQSEPFTDDLSQKTGEELWTLFEHGFEETASNVEENDVVKTQSALFLRQDELNRYLNEILWKNKQQNGTINLDSKIEALLRQTTDRAHTEFIQRTMFTQNLIHDVEQKSNGWCRSEEDSCSNEEFCRAAQCVSARGGNEVCTNGNDDDNDGLWDCNDPDCPSCEEMRRAEEREEEEENDRTEEENQEQIETPEEVNPEQPLVEEQEEETEEQNDEVKEGTSDGLSEQEQQGEENSEEGQQADSSAEEGEQSNVDNTQPSDAGTGSGIDLFNNLGETSPYRVLAEVMGKLIRRLPIGSATDIFEATTEQVEEPSAVPNDDEQQDPAEERSNNQPIEEEEEEEQREENSGEEQRTDSPPENNGEEQNNEERVPEDPTQEDQVEERKVDDSERENDERREEENDEPRDVCQSQCTECSTCDWQSDSERCEQVCKPCNLCRYQQGQYECHANEEFDQDRGFCMCLEGYSNCDGDWLNGCEKQGECQPCVTDDNCAPARCSEDNRRVATFRCEKGDSWEEVKRHLDIGGQCDVMSNGKTDSGFWIGGWGEGLQEFNLLKQQYNEQGTNEWCKQELEQALKERTLIEEGFTPSFVEWYFTEIVTRNPADFEQQVRTIHGLQDLLTRNADQIGRALSCLGKENVEATLKPIQITYQSQYGSIELWEEEKTTTAFGKPVKVLHPYLKMWIFPPKEFIIAKIKEEFSGIQGPRPDEIAEIQQEEMVMDEINKISERFENGAELLVQLKEKDAVLLEGVIRVNPEVIMQVEKVEDYTGERDATVTVDVDYLYATMELVLKEIEGERIQSPWWEKQQQKPFNDAFVGIKILGKAVVALTNGDIDVEPDGQMAKIVLSLKEIMTLMTTIN